MHFQLVGLNICGFGFGFCVFDSSPQGTTLACHDDIAQRDMEKKASVCVDNFNFDLGFGNGPTTMTIYTYKEEARLDHLSYDSSPFLF